MQEKTRFSLQLYCRAPLDGDDVKMLLLAAAASFTDSGDLGWCCYESAAMKTYVYPSAIDVYEIYYVDADDQVRPSACQLCVATSAALLLIFASSPTVPSHHVPEAKSSTVTPHVVQVSDTFCPDDAECEVVIGLIVHIRPHPYGFWLSPSTVAYSVLTALTSSSFQVCPA